MCDMAFQSHEPKIASVDGSPIALDLIAKLAGDAGWGLNLCVFYLLSFREVDGMSPYILAFLILRLLGLSGEALRDKVKFSDLRVDLEDYARIVQSPNPSSDDLNRKLQSVALKAVNIYNKKKTIWIAIPRPCR